MLYQESEKKSRIYLRIKDGKLIARDKDGRESSFQKVQGALKGIELKEHEFDNKKFKNWHIVMEDILQGDIYDIAVARSSGAFKGIVRCLVTEQGLANLDDISIETYLSKTGFTNAVVQAQGQNLRWTDEKMPEAVRVKVGDQEVVDDTAQMNWIQTLVDRVNARIAAGPAPAKKASAEEDDMPDDLPFE